MRKIQTTRFPQRQRGIGPLKILVIVVVASVSVLFIGGCLGAIGLPAFSDYQRRARLVAGIEATADVKQALRSYFNINGRWPSGSSRSIHQRLGLPAANRLGSNDVESITVEADGQIRIAFTDDAGRVVLLLTPHTGGAMVEWRCTGANAARPTQLPSECR